MHHEKMACIAHKILLGEKKPTSLCLPAIPINFAVTICKALKNLKVDNFLRCKSNVLAAILSDLFYRAAG